MSKALSRLEKVELREIWPDEAQHFTPWLAKEENLALLGDTLGLELELEAQEIYVGDFRADILCRNPENPESEMWVLIENQLGETNHRHLGQILTYSAGLDAHTVIWIAKRFREEHRAALDYLNGITGEHFQYFGVEIKVWQIGNSDPAPQFDIVSSPNDWRREVSHGTGRAVNMDLSKARLQRRKFWAQFQDYINKRNSQLQSRERKSTRYIIFDIGRRGFAIEVWMSKRYKGLGVQLYLTGQNAISHFHLLSRQREEIENELGEPLEWQEERCRTFLWQDSVDPTNEDEWSNQHEWLASKLELFDKVFRPRVKILNAADWEPPEDKNGE